MSDKMSFVKMHVFGAEYLLVDASSLGKIQPSDFDCCIVTYEPSAICDIKISVHRDGKEILFDANAVCCIGRFLYDKGLVIDKYATVETSIGIFEVKFRIGSGNDPEIELNAGRVKLKTENILPDFDQRLIRFCPINIGGEIFDITVVHLGIHHIVVFLSDPLDDFDIDLFAKHFGECEVSLVCRTNGDHLRIRSLYQNRELPICGTAACAVVVAAAICGIVDFDTYIKAEFKSGELLVLCNRDIEAFLKCSPAYVKEF